MQTRRAWGLAALSAAALGAAGVAWAEDRPKSGLEVGEYTQPFDVLDVTGPNKGTSLCYR